MIADAEIVAEPGAEDTTPLNLPVATTVEMVRSWYMSAAGILRASSEAWNANRRYQRYMRLDPDIMAPLIELQTAVCCLPWSIEVDDFRDAEQIEAAAAMKRKLDRCPMFPGLLRHLVEAVWYGPSAVNVIYGLGEGGACIEAWQPFHPDSLVFHEDGRLGFKVGPRYRGETEIGWDSKVRKLTDHERGAVCLHRHFVEAPDFDSYNDAAVMHAGRGIRDIAWYAWFLKQTIMQNWATYCERYGMGIRKGYYEAQNKAAKDQMDGILRNLRGDVNALIARGSDGTTVNDVEIMEPSSSGSAEIFATLIEWLVGHLKELIIGQKTSSEAVSTGLGSNVADKQDDTKRERIMYTANALADSVTREIVHQLWSIDNGPGTPCPLRFTFPGRRRDPDKLLSAVEKATKLGIKVAVRDVREALGFREPGADEEVVELGIEADIPPGMDEMSMKSALRGRRAPKAKT